MVAHAGSSYIIDRAAAEALAHEWGAVGEVEILRRRQVPHGRWGFYRIAGDCNGWHRVVWDDDPYEWHHRIALVSELPAWKAARTLAHELQHAVQASVAIAHGGGHVDAWNDYARAEKRKHGTGSAHEIEARARADRDHRIVYQRCIKERAIGGRRPTDVPVEPFRVAALIAVEDRQDTWNGLAHRIGWEGHKAGQRLRRTLGLRAGGQTHVRYETALALMRALHLDPFEVGL